MAKLIKRGTSEFDISPDTGLPIETTPSKRSAAIIDRETHEAKSTAQQIIERAEADAEQIMAEAQAQAEQIVANAQAEANAIKQSAYEQGLAEGKAQGATELVEIVARSSQRLQQIEDQIVPQLKELAVKIARKILGKELEFHPDSVVHLIREALAEKARQRREVFLRVNPDDLAAIREHKADLIEVLSRAKEIGIREDPSVSRYGVIIETDAGTIDAQLDTQLAVFERVLKDVK